MKPNDLNAFTLKYKIIDYDNFSLGLPAHERGRPALAKNLARNNRVPHGDLRSPIHVRRCRRPATLPSKMGALLRECHDRPFFRLRERIRRSSSGGSPNKSSRRIAGSFWRYRE